MQVVMDVIQGPTTLRRDLQLLGVVQGDLTVPRGAYLELLGTVAGDLVVLPGGRADVLGTVTGSVLNQGGTVSVLGVVMGRVVDSGPVATSIDPNAVVGPRRG
jgi:hypothetical protein